MISSQHLNFRLVDRRYEGDPSMCPGACAHHCVRARINRSAVSTSMIQRPTIDEQACGVGGMPHDLYAIQIRQIKDDALAPSGTHYKIPSGESVQTREQRHRSKRAALSSSARAAA